MSVLIISILICFIIFSFKFIYEKILIQIEELQNFNKEVIQAFKNLEVQVSEYQRKQEDLEESFRELKITFQELKEIATEIKSAEQTKKAILELIPR
ncbi:MAG: hypothetical protein OXJ52_00390 [Oligoflexia bacterium]|nr:hypothetical protein [Oligoflexia bacterium]